MARFEYNIRRLVRLAACLALVGMSSSAVAQIDERDRLERCANNRARMLEIQSQWPTGEAGWSDEQIALALAALRNLETANRRAQSLFNDPSSLALSDAADIVREMVPIARQFDITCFPFGIACGNVFVRELENKIDAAETGRSRRAALLQRFNAYRSNYIALDCVRGAIAQNSTSDISFALMTGTFDSSFGLLTLSTGGGSYDYQGGQIRVTGISGNVMEGIWTQTRSAEQCSDGQYRGRFRFEFSATGFSGNYSYCDGTNGGAWNGTRRQ